MSTRRVILGNLGGGQYGLRVALPGHDVVTEGGNPEALSFDSGWTDVVKMIQVGVATTDGGAATWYDVFFPDPGYIPFVEVRVRVGDRVYDEYLPGGTGTQPGVVAHALSDRLQISNGSYSVVYNIFAIPVPYT